MHVLAQGRYVTQVREETYAQQRAQAPLLRRLEIELTERQLHELITHLRGFAGVEGD